MKTNRLQLLYFNQLGLILSLICYSTFTLAQNKPETTVLKGSVILNQLGGKGIDGVIISADGANQTKTNDDGGFKLVFSKNPGDPYQLRISRDGWVVVNHHILSGNLPNKLTTQYSKPSPVILAKTKEREQWAILYYRIELRNLTEQNFEEQIAQLEGDNKELQQQRLQLIQDRKKALNQVDEMAKQLAKADLDNADNNLYQRALGLFLNNKTDKALEVLNDLAIDSQLKAYKEQQERLVDTLILKGNMLVSKLDFDNADKVYHQLADNFSDSLSAQLYAGFYFHGQKQFNAAKKALENALKLETTSPSVQGGILNSLGLLYTETNDLENALSSYNKALNLLKRLEKNEQSTYLSSVATVLNSLGMLHFNKGDYNKAFLSFNEALDIRKELAIFDPEQNLPHLATTQNNLGALFGHFGYKNQAFDILHKALKVRRKLAETNPQLYSSDVAMTLINIGNLYARHKSLDKASKAYNEALAIHKNLAKTNPHVFLSEVALVSHNLGELLIQKKSYNEAQTVLHEALNIRKKLALNAPEVYLPQAIISLYSIIKLYSDMGDINKALITYNEFIDISHPLAKTNPDFYLPLIATSLISLGKLYISEQKIKEGKQKFLEAKSIFKKLAIRDPKQFARQAEGVSILVKIIEHYENDQKNQH